MRIRSRRIVPIVVLVAASVALSGCAAETDSPYPDAIAVIGHSGATGWNSNGDELDAKENSWATGENPEVNSIYGRILADNPTIADHATNLAISGSWVDSLIEQASELVDTAPETDLVLIQSIDNDIHCDGTDAENYEPFRAKLTEVMDELSSGLPDARVFFVSQWASVKTYDSVAVPLKQANFAGNGPCDVVLPGTMQISPEREATLQGLVDDYWQIVTEVCAEYPACDTDGGIMQSLALTKDMLAPDLQHLSVHGQAAMAELAWKALYPEG